jgi:hypothetical protein
MQNGRNMRFVRSFHLNENKQFTSKMPSFGHFASEGLRERQLPKLNVAGLIPVSRSKRISSLRLPVPICALFVLRSHHQ